MGKAPPHCTGGQSRPAVRKVQAAEAQAQQRCSAPSSQALLKRGHPEGRVQRRPTCSRYLKHSITTTTTTTTANILKRTTQKAITTFGKISTSHRCAYSNPVKEVRASFGTGGNSPQKGESTAPVVRAC